MADHQIPPLRTDIDISKPRYDQEDYLGRVKHFFNVTFPLNIFASTSALDNAKSIVDKYRNKEKLHITEDELWAAKNLYDSAYHPDTGEKIVVFGRMSSQPLANVLILGGMLTFYKATVSVVFWQWLNQTYNAAVNYCNRSGDAPIPNEQLAFSYAAATSGAVGSALFLNSQAKRFSPMVGRCVPFAAVMVANCINIPLMRYNEFKVGTPVYTKDKKKVGDSVNAAAEGILQVIFSRILMAAPSMLVGPFVIDRLEKRGIIRRYPWVNLPAQAFMVGLMFTFAVPLACGIFKQEAAISHDRLEKEIQARTSEKVLYYNKGL